MLGRQGVTLRPEDAPEEWRKIERSDEDDLCFSIQLPAWLLAELGLDPENDDLEGRWELDELQSDKRLLLFVDSGRSSRRAWRNGSEKPSQIRSSVKLPGQEKYYRHTQVFFSVFSNPSRKASKTTLDVKGI